MPAQSLLDASSLPTWLGGPSADQAPAPAEAPLGGRGLAANTLVDERSLPLWLRQEPATPAVDGPPAGSISQWLAGPVTDEPLPAWLNQVYAEAQVPRMQGSAPLPQPFASSNPGAGARLGSMAAGQLVDDSALPDWLRAQAGPSLPPAGGTGYAPPQPMPGSGYGGQPGSGAGAFGSQPGNGGYAFDTPGGNGSGAFGGFGAGAYDAPGGDGAGAMAFGTPAGAPGSGWWTAPQDSFGSGAGGQDGAGTFGGLGGGASAPGKAAQEAEGGAVASFSASDLIDPQVLPSWVRQEQAAAEPVFSSSQGWTSKQVSLPIGQGGAGASAGNGGGWAFDGEAGAVGVAQEANLPPWLSGAGAGPAMAGAAMEAPAASGPGSNGGRRPMQGTIPDAELPPWLRDQGQRQGRGNGSGGWPGGGGASGWDGQQEYGGARAAMGQGAPAPEPGMGEEFSDFWDDRQVPSSDQPEDHYADRFGDERPGVPGRFSYEYDRARVQGDGNPGGAGAEQDWEWSEPQKKTGKRKRWFGRK